MYKLYAVQKHPKWKIKGFTLAEILITLLIIGVVASLVIPTLINDMQDSQYKVAYKKAFAVASQAWNTAVSNNEIIQTGNTELIRINFSTFKSYFKTIKECSYGAGVSNCWADGETFGGAPGHDYPAFIDASGMAWTIADGSWDYIMVDTNGFKVPNKYGKDRFIFLCKSADGSGNGVSIKIGVYIDFPNNHNVWCPSGGCYYQSWLSQ